MLIEQIEISDRIDKMQTALNTELDTSIEGSRMYQLSRNCIYGTDANPRMARTSKMNMIMHGDGHGGVHHHDGLLNVNGIFEERFDVILTNPPFGQNVDRNQLISVADRFTDEEMKQKYKAKYGKSYDKALKQVDDHIGESLLSLYDLGSTSTLTEVLFMERCLRLLKKGGRMGMVLPEGVLNNKNLASVREYFEGRAKLILICSIPQDVFIAAGATVKPSLVFMRKFTAEETGMDLLYIKKGDLLVSSINFHQGAVAINNIGDFVCSTHYQSFSIDTTSVVPEYLITVLRSKSFINMVAGLKANGIKNESGYDFIGGFGIPVPSIPEQQEILKAYHTTLAEAGDNIAKGDSFSDGLLSDIQSKVSTLKKQEHRIETLEAIMQIIPFAATRRWEVGYILKEGRLEDIYGSFKYKSYSIHELQTESLFGLSVKASLEQKKEMIPVLRMSNVVNGEIDYSELKYLPLKCATTNKEPDKWLLRNGDFLITRTNGSKDLVGKAAVFHGKDVYTYASYLIRYRFDISIVLPEYVNILFMTQLVREQIAVMRRQGGGQYNLNSDEIGAIRIPVPSIPEQQAIVAAYDSAKDGANIYYDKGQTLKEKAAADFEKCIFA